MRTLLLLACALGTAHAQPARKPPSIDGTYLTGGGLGVLTLAGRHFTAERVAPDLKTTIRGRVHRYGAHLQLRYHSGARPVQLHATMAIVDGQLWLGVLHRRADTWYSEQRMAPLLALDAGPMGAGYSRWSGSVNWNRRTHLLRVTPQRENPAAGYRSAGTLRCTARRVDVPGAKDRFVWRFATYRDLSALASGVRRAATPGRSERIVESEDRSSAYCALGVFGVVDAAVLPKLHGFRTAGDVILAPWSICLGPVGQHPAKRATAEVTGRWVDERDAAVSLRVVAPTKMAPFAGVVFGDAGLERLTRRLPYQPDARGVAVRTFVQNCQMGHADWPGRVVFFVTKAGRLVRRLIPSNHGPVDARPLRVYRKAPR